MQKQSATINSIGRLLADQQQGAWDAFWQRVDELDAFIEENGWVLADWVRAPQLMYRHWRLGRVIKRLNRAFGRG